TPEQVALGQSRYNQGAADDATRVACASCHGLANGVDHSPLFSSFWTDQQLIEMVETGRIEFGDGEAYEARGVNHVFNLTEEERAGVAAYLRSLTPSGF